MTVRTSIDVATITRIGHDEAMGIATVIRTLAADDWTLPTDCERWDVHAIVAHVIGATAGQASFPEFARQAWRGRPITAELRSPHWWDGMNELQVRERAGRTAPELLAEFTTLAPKSVRARARLPRPIAQLPLLNLPSPVGRQPLAYLFDVGFTRDTWMHRVDIAQATGGPMVVDPAHDGRIVADMVAEWADTHGEPFLLELTGPAGGSFRAGPAAAAAAEHHELDAIEFTRILAERAHGIGVLRHSLPL
jgi:uncharacterized protein (TIGR03083 family)